MAKHNVGDVVVLVDPERWIQPFRKWGEQGRKAEVVAIRTDPFRAGYRIRFQSKRHVKHPSDYELYVYENEVRPAPETEEPAP